MPWTGPKARSRPSTLVAFAKTEWLEHRLTMNGAVYYLDWINIQQNVTLPTCGENLVGNFGSGRPDARVRAALDATSAEYTHAIDANTSEYLRGDFSSTTREDASYNPGRT